MTKKYRNEIKFFIHENQAEELKRNLSKIMSPDVNGKDGYFIRSLYFDTPTASAYYEKLDGVEYRKKYRIRMYNQRDDYICLEKKMKDNNMTAKEQVVISKEECLQILNNDFSMDDYEDGLLKEFLLELKMKNLMPSVIVDYDRYALTYPVSDVRITFDSNIRSGVYNYDLFDYHHMSFQVLEDHMMILEVKFNEMLPEVIGIILRTIPSIRSAYSKFAICSSVK